MATQYAKRRFVLVLLAIVMVSGAAWANMGTAVGPVTATITALNFDESGAMVNGFLVGTNTLLVFPKPTCNGIGTLGVVGNSITYSGTEFTQPTHIIRVQVSSFTNHTTGATYPPAPNPKPVAYPATAGAISALNYDLENGVVNGFRFTPTGGAAVFVDIGYAPSTALLAALTVGTSATVTGVLESPPTCATAGTISEVDATTIAIGSKVYTLRRVP